MIAEGLKIDLHGTGVRVTNLEPGMVETDFSTVRFRGDAARAAQVYADTTPLTPDDVADAVLYALTRPLHVNVSEILLLATAQSTATMVDRPGQR
jgi:NADP-dependent 3-hydroxy acid dehydrogenase YdfG